MNKIIKSLLAAGVLFTVIGCSKDQTATKFNPSKEDAAAAYFSQKSVSEEFVNTATGDQKLLVDVYRQNNAGDAIVGVEYTIPGDSYGIYSIPESVAFKNGEFKATLEITVHDVAAFAKGAVYSAKIGIGDHHEFKDVMAEPAKLSKYARAAATRSVDVPKYTEITISTSLALDWQPAYVPKDLSNLIKEKPEGTSDEDWYMIGEDGKPMPQTTKWYDFWGMENSASTENLAVQRAAGTNVYRILNAGDGGANIIFTIDPSEDNKVTVDGKKYFRCVMTAQDTKIGYDAENNVWISDFPSASGGSISYDAAPCYWDGQNVFYFVLYWHVPGLGGFNNPDLNWTDAFEFKTGNEKPEPSVDITYVGVSTSGTGVKSHSLAFEPNDAADHYYATILKEDLSLIEDEAELAAKLEAIQAQIEEGSYKGDFPVILYDAKAQDAWNLGTEKGIFSAVAFSYTADNEYKGIDFKPFLYNPEGDPAEIQYAFMAGAGGFGTDADFTDYSMGYFGDNSVMIACEGSGDLTAVKYALVSKADFEAAGLADADDAALIAYVNQNGRSFNDAALKDANGFSQNGNNYIYLSAAPSTEYKVIAAISNADATAVDVSDVMTEAAGASAFKFELSIDEYPDASYYRHTHVLASFTGSHVVGGNYLMMSTALKDANGNPTTFAQYFKLGADGKLSMNTDVTDDKVLALIQSKGSAFSTGADGGNPAGSALYLMNSGDVYDKFIAGAPETEYVVLSCADFDGTGAKSWSYDIATTDFAPAVNFSQKLRADGKNLRFTWSAEPTDNIFEIQKVVYALVPKSALTDAGVDMAKIGDEMLNDFDARRAASGADKAAIDAQEQNAAKVLGILKQKGKTFKGDAEAPVNKPGGLTKQFENLAAGDYALIAMAYDSYNTKLTIGQITIE